MEHEKETMIVDFVSDIKSLITKYNNEFNKDYKRNKFMADVFLNGHCISLSYLIASISGSKDGDIDADEVSDAIDKLFTAIINNIRPCFNQIKETKDKLRMDSKH